MRALAVFRDSPDWRARWLRRGFRHVLAAVEIEEGVVVVIDPSGGGLHPWAGGCSLEDVAAHYRGEGSEVVETEADPGGSLLPGRMTCVEVVKRLLGTRGWFIWTPYRLYRRLICESD